MDRAACRKWDVVFFFGSDARLLLAITGPTWLCDSNASRDGLSQRIDHMTGEEDPGS